MGLNVKIVINPKIIYKYARRTYKHFWNVGQCVITFFLILNACALALKPHMDWIACMVKTPHACFNRKLCYGHGD